MVDARLADLKFLRESCDIGLLWECTREAVTMFFEGDGIPNVPDEQPKEKKSMLPLVVHQ